MKKRFLLLTAVLTVNLAYADDSASTAVPTVAQITERWRAYFETLNNLPSWTYSAHMQLHENNLKNPTALPRLVNDTKFKFAKDKNMFRREMQVREDAKADFQKVTMAFAGQKYQMAVYNPKAEDIGGHKMHDLMQQSLKPIPDDPTDSVTMHFALAMPFFLLIKTADGPLNQLVKPAAWADFQKHITKVEPSTWQNRPGFLLTLSPPADAVDITRGELFMDAASSLPMHFTSFSKATGTAMGELKITKLQDATATTPAFPLLIEISGADMPNDPGGHGIIEVDPASLNFAPTFAPGFFKIPASAVEIITEGDKVVYSRYPLPKEPTKSKAPAHKQTKAKH